MRAARPWVGWGEDPREHPFASWRLRDLPGPPRTRHITSFSCCAGCTEALDVGARCTTSEQFQRIQTATDHDLFTGKTGGCLLDREDELEHRFQRRRYAAPITEPRRLSDRLTDFLRRS